MSIHKLTDSPAEPDEYYLAPQKLIAGNPKQTLWMQLLRTDLIPTKGSKLCQDEFGTASLNNSGSAHACQ